MHATASALVYDLTLYRDRVLRVCEHTEPRYATPRTRTATDEDWKRVDTRMTELGVERAAHEHEVCHTLIASARLAVPGRVGMASLREYAHRRLGLNGRQTEERLRVGRALQSLPAIDEAFGNGQFCWSAVRELTRVAVAETDGAWCAWARGKTSGEIEKAVPGLQSGDRPTDLPDPSRIQHRLRFEVRAETMALFRELQAAIREELGEELGGEVDDDLMLHEIARRALGGPDDGGRAPYQVHVSRCDRCQEVAIDAGGERHPVDAVVAEMIACDAQHIPRHIPQHIPQRIPQHIPQQCSPAGNESPQLGARGRATQTVRPAARREVLRRGGSACIVPGCRNHRHLHVHHVEPRSEGGGHEPVLLAALCHRHHSVVHDGTLRIHGDAVRGFTFHHADGSAYGQPLAPAAVEVAQQAFAALRHLGFTHTQANKLVETVQRDGAPDTLEAFMQAALVAS